MGTYESVFGFSQQYTANLDLFRLTKRQRQNFFVSVLNLPTQCPVM